MARTLRLGLHLLIGTQLLPKTMASFNQPVEKRSREAQNVFSIILPLRSLRGPSINWRWRANDLKNSASKSPFHVLWKTIHFVVRKGSLQLRHANYARRLYCSHLAWTYWALASVEGLKKKASEWKNLLYKACSPHSLVWFTTQSLPQNHAFLTIYLIAILLSTWKPAFFPVSWPL